MKIGALIIGDEIMSGKRQDRHFAFLQSVLAKRGLELSWTLIVGDDPEQLERSMRFTMSSDDLVFSFGGIGATPDDRTRQTAAKVKGLAIKPHPEAVALIQSQYGEAAYPHRILMAHLPEGSRLIPNPINRVAGFSVDDHHFMPGFPEMAWPMVEWVLDTHYAHLRNLKPANEEIIHIIGGRESEFLTTMNAILENYPTLLLSSLPHLGDVPFIEFSLRGNQKDVQAGMAMMINAVESAELVWHDQTNK
jgi:molybdopterin-biosynthesis enzyme MoeA-like protein